MSARMTALREAPAQPQTDLPQMPRKPRVNACRMHVQSPSYEGLNRTLRPDPGAAVDTGFC